jgi:ATP-dependent DNA ligase
MVPVMLPFDPPLEPMLAKAAEALPEGAGWIYEPKWDGFRVLVFRDGEAIHLQSRDTKSLNRYFPELEAPLRERLPQRCVLDGELVIAGPRGLDFEALLLRIHPAASRVALLAKDTPSELVVWDLLALGDRDLRGAPFAERRAELERALEGVAPPVHVTPATRELAVAKDWFRRFEGAGLDGVVAKRDAGPYEPGKRVMVKVKHARTADCVVGGFRWHANGPGVEVGSLLVGLFDDAGVLQHAGVASGFSAAQRRTLAAELEPLRADALRGHPWREWREEAGTSRMPGATSRWNRGKSLEWEPVRPERVVEVSYDHLQGDRFRHATHLVRWRPDKRPEDCRYDQLEQTPAFELQEIFGGRSGGAAGSPDQRGEAPAKGS